MLVLSSIGVVLFLHLLPGDPAILMAGADAPQATIDAVRQEMGFDKRWPSSTWSLLGHVAGADFGKSTFSKLPVSQLIAQRAPRLWSWQSRRC